MSLILSIAAGYVLGRVVFEIGVAVAESIRDQNRP